METESNVTLICRGILFWGEENNPTGLLRINAQVSRTGEDKDLLVDAVYDRIRTLTDLYFPQCQDEPTRRISFREPQSVFCKDHSPSLKNNLRLLACITIGLSDEDTKETVQKTFGAMAERITRHVKVCSFCENEVVFFRAEALNTILRTFADDDFKVTATMQTSKPLQTRAAHA